jgi:hypothetical protein
MAGETATGIQGIGAILGMIGAFSSAQGQKSNLRAQADIAEINATTAENSARAALFAGQHEEQRSMLATANLKSTQQAGFAANGVDLGEGSAARTLASTDVMGTIDKYTIAADAVRTAWGYRTQATNYQNEALMKRSGADSISPVMAGATSLISSAGSVAQNWYALNKTGGNDSGVAGHSAYWKS